MYNLIKVYKKSWCGWGTPPNMAWFLHQRMCCWGGKILQENGQKEEVCNLCNCKYAEAKLEKKISLVDPYEASKKEKRYTLDPSRAFCGARLG